MSDFAVITGMSGAGRSTAAAALEDLGWFVIDNMPPTLITKVAELVGGPGSETERVAIVIGRGGSEYLDELGPALEALRARGDRVRVLFLDASDEALVRRFEGTRRRHPLPAEGVVGSIAQERKLLDPLKGQADVVVDTTELNVHQLTSRVAELFQGNGRQRGLQVTVLSFGFKHGVPLDVDMVLDCRFLPNPHWVEGLRGLTGLDKPVRQYVLEQPEAQAFLEKLGDLLGFLLPAYVKEGKSYLTIAIGCTGGQHRSVVLAEELASRVDHEGLRPAVHHRDVYR
ncbi:MAG: RNase adapter RapZ [Acidimicrobiales bacterium]|nr:RNase adapter RapZ [Acidimicrobiales bacterium]MBO0885888.1 RNase adapter RapZ [Acidimicrobiales bacterium]